MKAAMMAAVFFLSTVAQASSRRAPPVPPEPPMAPEPPEPPDPPEIHVHVPRIEVPEIDIPDIEVNVPDFTDIAGAFMAHRDRDRDRNRDRDDDEDDDDDDRDQQRDGDRDENGVHVYKMTPAPPRIVVPRVRVRSGEDDDRWDDRDATAQARGKGSVSLPVKGPVTLQLRVQSGDLEVTSSSGNQVRVTLDDSPDQDIALYAFGDRVQPVFRGRTTLRHGRLKVQLPAGSRLDVTSMSGDLVAQKMSEVRVRTMSGDVKLSSVAKADIETISGDVHIDEATGPVRLHTVSGKAVVSTEGTPQIDFQSASGDMDWTGTCAKDCHLNAETVSGELTFIVDPRSSFALSYTSHSGELRDGVNLEVKRSPARKHGMFSGGWLEATYGRGEGVIDADAFSGNLTVKKK